MNIFGYQIETTLFESEKSIIYRTKPDKRNKLQKILKVHKGDFLPQEEKVRYQQEYTIAQTLDHPGILKSTELLSDDQDIAIVFENFKGYSLQELATKDPISLKTALSIAIQLSTVLEYIHTNKIIHKDICPGNILWNSDTDELRLIDFGIATSLEYEHYSGHPTDRLEGTIQFISPEQTGRMNRIIDYRTDFYSMGMTLYLLFTGKLPFTTSDPLEILHFHLARTIPRPSTICPTLPQQLSEITLKLLEKEAENRYQTAYGIRRDLEECSDQLQLKKSISVFPLARHDIYDRLNISQKIYGRETEINQLLHAFDRVSHGTSEMIFVAGYSGVGKTALINEVHKPIAEKKGVFISGKYDQYQRNTPYYAFIRIFSQLVRNVLLLPESQLESYRSQIIAALGHNAGILTNLVPDLEILVGKHEEMSTLGSLETQNLFNELTRRFIKIFATAEHPLALFIDDFQWADLASLQMLNVLLTDQTVKHLLILGSYRDNEVHKTHPLLLAKEEIEKKAAINTITLEPLSQQHVNALIRDTFHVSEDNANTLSILVMEKTLGNPFFINHFLKRLHDDGLIVYDQLQGSWCWEIDRIHERDITDNVVELMLSRLSKLPSETRELMMIASCIGEQISLTWLAAIIDRSVTEVTRSIWPIVKVGLMLPLADTGKYIQVLKELPDDDSSNSIEMHVKFLHDRVQQAAYSMIPENEREAVHLLIGRKLREFLSVKELNDNVFTIISQFNFASQTITDKDEKLAMAKLNLQAALKAKATLANESAIELLDHGVTMLDGELAVAHPDLFFELLYERAEAYYYIADLLKAEQEFEILLKIANTTIKQGRIYRVLVDLYTTKGEIEHAVKAAIAGCDLFGITLYLHPTRDQVLEVYEEILGLIGTRNIEDLVNLPDMDNPEMELALSILAAMMPPALFYDQNLLYLEHCHMVHIALRHGNAPASASGYAYFGMIIGCMLGAFEQGYKFGKLGYSLLSKEGYEQFRAKVCLSFGSNVNFWVNHVTSDLQYLEEGFKAALETGDVTYSCYHCNHIVMVNLASGMDLEQVFVDAEKRKKYVATTGYTEIVDIIESKQRLVQLLRGKTNTPHSYSDETFNEVEFEQHLQTNMSITVCWYYIHKTQARYLFGYFEEAVAAAQKAEELIWSSVAHVEVPEHYLYYSLALTALHSSVSKKKQREIVTTLNLHLDYFKQWKASCSDNFEHKYLLIEAEFARIEGKQLEALQGYEKCIAEAHKTGFIQIEALANELAGRHSLECGLKGAAKDYLAESLHYYRQWKAIGKLKHLEQEFSGLFRERSPHKSAHTHTPTPTNTFFASAEEDKNFVDYQTIVNISRAIATQMDMSVLLTEIMKYTLENTGAEKASIVIINGENIRVEVAADEETIHSGKTAGPVMAQLSRYISEAIIRYVARTDETLILENASLEGDFTNDPYVLSNNCKSILCMPFSYKKGQNRILFIENNQIVDAFPRNRVETLRLILPQVAISIENAQLFTGLNQAHEQLRSIFDNSVDGIGVAQSGIHTLVNPAYMKMFGYEDRTQLINQPLLEIIAPDKRPQFMAYLTEKEDSPVRDIYYETKGIRKNGTEFALEVNVSQYGTEEDRNTLLILRDASERIQLEDQVRQAQKMEAIGTLAGGIAHDFNNILSAIIGYSELARLDAAASEKLKKYLDAVLNASNRAKGLIEQILAFSRQTNTNRLPLKPVTIVEEVVRMLRPSLPTTIEITQNISAEVGFILADPIQIHQILMNLSTNAFHAMEKTGGMLSISMKNVDLTKDQLPPDIDIKAGNYVQFSVGDTGPGISPEIQSKIFDPYFTTKGQGKGTGMGLAIVHGTVKSYGGFLSLDSVPEKGTTFDVFLPVFNKEQIHSRPEVIEQYQTGRESILFIDDEPHLANMGREILEQLGYTVSAQTSGAKALEVFNKNPDTFDLVITDQTMPGMTGVELAENILQTRADIPIILCTGYSSITSREEAKASGIREFVLKPLTVNELSTLIRQVLQ